MAKQSAKPGQLPTHGASVLPSVEVKSYNVEIEDEDGFIGDKAGKGAFWDALDKWRKPLRKLGEDPLGDKASEDIGKKKLAEILRGRRARGGGCRPKRGRGLRPAAYQGHSPLPAAEGMARYGVPRHRRRISRKPHRRAGRRPQCRTAQSRRDRRRPGADPQRSRRSRPDRRRTSAAGLDAEGARLARRRGRRRHQHPRRAGRAQPQEIERPRQGAGGRSRSCGVTARRRSAGRTPSAAWLRC